MSTTLEKSKVELPKGFTARGAMLDDVEAAVKLFNTWSQTTIYQNEFADSAPLRSEWETPGFNPATDICLIFSSEGMLVGYIEVWTTSKPPVHPWLLGRVHPEFGELGIGTWLLQWAEERACKVLDILPADLRFAPRTGIYNIAQNSKKLFEDRGFARIRSSYEMRIDMEEAPPTPLWADGITLRTANAETDARAIYQVDRDSFRDHFGYIEEPFEEGFKRFSHFLLGEGSDPSLWFLAMDGDEIAGISLCRPSSYDDPDLGWVNILGVRREWRKRGIGLALLQHSFGEFYRRGKRKVGLGVDAENLTGALKLYEQAGMHIHLAFDLFEKTIRSGREISVESLLE